MKEEVERHERQKNKEERQREGKIRGSLNVIGKGGVQNGQEMDKESIREIRI